jgi:hypothetical protein
MTHPFISSKEGRAWLLGLMAGMIEMTIAIRRFSRAPFRWSIKSTTKKKEHTAQKQKMPFYKLAYSCFRRQN